MTFLEPEIQAPPAPVTAPKNLLAFPLISRVLPLDAFNPVGLTKILIALMLSYKLQETTVTLVMEKIANSPLRFPIRLIARLADIPWVPVVALLFIVSNSMLISRHMPKMRVDPPAAIFRFAAILFGLMLVINLMEAPPDLYLQYSTILMTEGPTIVVMFLCLRDHQGMRYFLGALAFWGITTTCTYLLLGVSPLNAAAISTMEGRLAIGDNPITAGMSYCIAALSSILAALILKSKGKYLYAGLFLASATYLFLCSLLTGTRGPIVAFVVCVITYCIVTYKFKKKMLIPFLLLCGLLIVSYLFVSKIGPLAERISISDEASVTRLSNLTYALSSMPTLFGHGVGGFRQYIAKDRYIHNCLVESYYEHGVLGVILYVPTVIGALIVLYRRQMFFADIPSMLPLLLFIFYIVESQFSGTLYSFMPLWALFIYAAIPLTIEKRQAYDHLSPRRVTPFA